MLSLREWWKLGLHCIAVAAALAFAADSARADAWFRAVQSGAIAYLPVYSEAPRIERYDLAARAWLAPVPVPERPNVVAVTPDALYVQSDTQLRRISHAGAVIWSVPNAANYLVADPAGRVFSTGFPEQDLRAFDAADGELLDEIDLGAAVGPTSADGLSIAPGRRRLFFTLHVGGRRRLGAVDYDAAGSFGPLSYSEPQDQSFNTFVFPGEDLVAGGEGGVFDADTLEWRNSFFGPVDQLIFDGSTPIRVGWGVSRYTTDFELVGARYPFDIEAAFAHDGTYFELTENLFTPPNPPASIAEMPVGSIAFPPLPTPYPEPAPSPGTPRALGIDVHGTISFPHGASPGPSLYRWSVPEGDFAEPVALRALPGPHGDCPLLGGMLYGSGTGHLRLLPYDETEDRFWRNLRSRPSALACTDTHVVVVTPGGVATYAADGTDADSVAAPGPYTYYDAVGAWSAARNRLYVWMDGFASEDQLSSYSIHADGTIEPVGQAPNAQVAGPIVAADGPLLVSGPFLYDSETLARGPRVANFGVLGAAWLDGNLYTLVEDLSSTQLVVRNAAGEVTRSARMRKAIALFGYEGKLRVGFYENGSLSVRTVAFDDLDADGVAGDTDAFPTDPDEWSDRDGDGVGDNGDWAPDDPSESSDHDDDGVGDNRDPFPYDPNEWSDRDGDGHGDNRDAFPDDRSEWYDRDGDGHGDNGDWAWQDPTEWADTDGDGVGDNADEFPLDPDDWIDSDRDGIGDLADPFPIGEPEVGIVGLTGKERAVFARIGAVTRDLPPSTLGLLPNGAFSLCDDRGRCAFGAHRLADARERRIALEIDPKFIAEIQPALEDTLEESLGGAFRNRVWLDLLLRPQDSSAVVKLDRSGTHGTLKVEWVFDAFLGNVPRPYQYTRFKLTWKFRRADVLRPFGASTSSAASSKKAHGRSDSSAVEPDARTRGGWRSRSGRPG